MPAQALYLREKDTPPSTSKKIANEVTITVTYEATKDFSTEDFEIETPLERTTSSGFRKKVPSAGPARRVGMLDGVLSLVSARESVHRLYRDEETLQPFEYYVTLPNDLADRDAIVLDPHASRPALECRGDRQVKEPGRRSGRSSAIVGPRGHRACALGHPDVRIVTRPSTGA